VAGYKEKITFDRLILEDLYENLNRRKFVHPDPLEFLYDYPDVRDREIVALVASTLAYGRVNQILRSVGKILALLGSPTRFVQTESVESMTETFASFKHRFTTGRDMALLLYSLKGILKEYGSLENCFVSGFKEDDETIIPALEKFVNKMVALGCGNGSGVIADPGKGSACKRLNLFLRWMVRNDDVDPGGWTSIPPSKLIIPLDTHMHNISRMLGITTRKQANMQTALEITEAFKSICPDDPVKYDFCLTRYGIRDDLSTDIFKNDSSR